MRCLDAMLYITFIYIKGFQNMSLNWFTLSKIADSIFFQFMSLKRSCQMVVYNKWSLDKISHLASTTQTKKGKHVQDTCTHTDTQNTILKHPRGGFEIKAEQQQLLECLCNVWCLYCFCMNMNVCVNDFGSSFFMPLFFDNGYSVPSIFVS